MNEKGFDPNYDDNKKCNTLYLLKKYYKSDGSTYRKAELILNIEETALAKQYDSTDSTPVKYDVLDQEVLYATAGGQQKIGCWLLENKDQRMTTALHIARRTQKGVYANQEVTLSFDAVVKLKQFLERVFTVQDDNPMAHKIPLASINTNNEKSNDRIITANEFAAIIKANIKDISELDKLTHIKKMETSIKRLENIIAGEYANEIDIQRFLKDNIWMFGNDYTVVLDNNKINTKNIMDIAPKNIESYIDIIEVKLPKEALFCWDESHSNYYPTSHLTKAVAQTQNYIYELELASQDDKYSNSKIVRPRGIILYGSQTELCKQEEKYLRILNASYHNLLIITYQQLLEKAKNTLSIHTDNS